LFKYRLQTPLGEDIGEASYGFLLEAGEVLTLGDQRLRVIDVIPLEEQGSEVTALLYVETA